MSTRFINGLFILVHSSVPPTDEEWAEFFNNFQRQDPRKVRTLVFTEGGGPSTHQRAEVDRVVKGRPSLVAVVSDNVWVRLISKAMSWNNPYLRVFSPASVEDAYRHLQMTPTEKEVVQRETTLMRQKLGL